MYRWYINATAFLERSRESLAAFDKADEVQQLFVAALMLRFGIEARLFEYIEAELPRETKDQDLNKISEFAASKLLAKLTRLNPRTTMRSQITIRRNDRSAGVALVYTPITKSLARLHGELGGLLHFNYFKDHGEWYVAQRGSTPAYSTILDARAMVAHGIEELSEATSGNLLNNPAFHQRVEALRAESSNER